MPSVARLLDACGRQGLLAATQSGPGSFLTGFLIDERLPSAFRQFDTAPPTAAAVLRALSAAKQIAGDVMRFIVRVKYPLPEQDPDMAMLRLAAVGYENVEIVAGGWDTAVAIAEGKIKEGRAVMVQLLE